MCIVVKVAQSFQVDHRIMMHLHIDMKSDVYYNLLYAVSNM